jgi:hypothetical protein
VADGLTETSIFRNLQRIPASGKQRILLIIGSEHLNMINLFTESSDDYILVSPLPLLEQAAQR